jgi:hypothetical protein
VLAVVSGEGSTAGAGMSVMEFTTEEEVDLPVFMKLSNEI